MDAAKAQINALDRQWQAILDSGKSTLLWHHDSIHGRWSVRFDGQ